MSNLSVHSAGDFTRSEVSTFWHHHLPDMPQQGHEWRYHCKLHGGTHDSFSVNRETGMWCCHSKCGRGGSMIDFEMAISNSDFAVAANQVRRIVGRPFLRQVDREPEMKWGVLGFSHQYLRERIEKVEAEHSWKHTSVYPYFFADGKLSYVKVRFIDKQNDKTFRQWAISSNGGWISRKKAGREPLLYRLNTLAAANEIFICNGEKAADRGAAELGIVTTCTPDGEGKWWGEYTKALLGKWIRVILDHDPKGELHGKVVAEALAPHVSELKIIRLPGLPPKADLYDWIESGGTYDQLKDIVANTPSMELPRPTAIAPPQASKVCAIAQTSDCSVGPRPAPQTSLLSQLRNDTGNADRLILKYGDRLRYCPPLKKWLVWDGRRWAVDGRGAARRLAKKTMLDYLAQAVSAEHRDHRKFAYASLDAKRITSLLTMAECELVIMPNELDTHPFLMNFKSGTLDLETGTVMPHDPEHYITKLVHYNYNAEALCPLFMAFIARIMGNHPDASEPELERADRMIAYLKRAFGYSLTGTTEEKAVFVLFGSGNNGKTTLLSLFLLLLEEYAVPLQVDTLMVRQESNNTQADLADLRGARFVMTSETEEGQRLSQSKLKRITQGMGKIKAVRKYENPIEFPETHKLWMDTNSKPVIRAADDQATFTRLHPIPFTVTIPSGDIDKSLPRKLLAEAEGVLAWAVQGALEWRRNGLGKPPEVIAANNDWRAENDQLGRFIDDCCVVGDAFSSRARPLYLAYREWVEGAGETPVSETMFGRRLAGRGFSKVDRKYGAVYVGIALRANESSSEEKL